MTGAERGSAKDVPTADLHTPDELLAVAQSLIAANDPKVRRAAVLEAITALEAYVERTVVGLLNTLVDPLLAKWIAERTRMDFDARLRVVTPFVLGRPVDPASDLWASYKRAKTIRNRVTHSGARVSSADAAFVVDTVRNWLAYLGSSAEVALSLQALKDHVEGHGFSVSDGRQAEMLVGDYFGDTSALLGAKDDSASRMRPDLVLAFGGETVVVEIKLVKSTVRDLESWIAEAASQALRYANANNITRAAVVIFVRSKPPEAYRTVRVRGGAVVVVVIEAPAPHGNP